MLSTATRGCASRAASILSIDSSVVLALFAIRLFLLFAGRSREPILAGAGVFHLAH
jgi:hypothetical protein